MDLFVTSQLPMTHRLFFAAIIVIFVFCFIYNHFGFVKLILSHISDIRDCILYCNRSPTSVYCHCCAWHTFFKCESLLYLACLLHLSSHFQYFYFDKSGAVIV